MNIDLSKRIKFGPVDFSKVFAYDMHFHTEHSFDSVTKVSHALKKAKQMNLNLAVTDHNVIGGSMKASKNRLGVKVIPGIEVTFLENKDLLFYFDTPGDLEDFYKKEIKPYLSLGAFRTKRNIFDFLEKVEDKHNFLLSAAHPYGWFAKNFASYMRFHKDKEYLLRKINAFEVLNSAYPKFTNMKTVRWAENLGKSITAGSDAHVISQLGCMVAFSNDDTDILESIRKNRNFVGGFTARPVHRVHYLKNALFNAVPKSINRVVKKERYN